MGVCAAMEDLVAVAISLTEGGTRYVLAYGRILDTVDPAGLEAVVLKSAQRSDLGGTAVAASVCASLGEASGEPYFFEALFEMSRDAVEPGRRGYARWKKRMAREMNEGRQIWLLGARE